MKNLTPETKQILILSLFFIIAVVLWNTPLIYPVKLFVVLLHEMSHGLMAELFGGDIIKIQIDPKIGGYCQYTMAGGWIGQFFITSAGYLGSMLWGGLILVLAAKVEKDQWITLTIGVVTLILSYFVIKTGEAFGIIFTLAFAVFMIGSVFFLKGFIHDYMLKFIGLVSCLYVVLDIKDDLITRSGIGSDADKIAEMTGIPSIVVGIIWLLIALVLLFFILRMSFKKGKKEEKEASKQEPSF